MSTSLPINLDDLLYQRGVESTRLELKATWDPKTTGYQVLRTICAFANDLQNLNGGYLLLGVEERDGQAVRPVRGLTPEQIEAAQKWIRGKCNRLDPVYQPVMSPEPVDDRHILVVWAPGSDHRPHQAPESLAKGATRYYYVRLGNETVEARGQLQHDLMQLTAKVPFDDRRALGVPLSRVGETRVRAFLTDIGSGLVEEREAAEIYRRMRLSVPVNGHEVPKNIALLFFADDPREWFPGAFVEVVQYAGGAEGNVIEERSFTGPLHEQLRGSLRYLANLSTRHLEKLPDRPEVKGWVSYPLPAVEEALVNAVYHRSYEDSVEPTKVYLYPDRMEIISYPGPVRGIERRHLRPGERLPPVPARNRRIGELLKELRLAEGRGTGVPKLFREMERNGSPEPDLDFDDDRTYFRVVLPAHPEYVAISALRDAAHLRAVGDRQAAVERLRGAFEERPGSRTLAVELVDELGRQGALDEAQNVAERFLAGASASPVEASGVLLALATVLINAGESDKGASVLDRLPAAVAPSEAFEAAILERRAGRQEQAHRLFERAGDAVYGDVRALHEFAQTKIRLARRRRGQQRNRYQREARRQLLSEARDMLRRVLQMDAPPTRHAWAWFDLGRVLAWLKEPRSQVIDAFEQACRLAPDEARFRRRLEEERDAEA